MRRRRAEAWSSVMCCQLRFSASTVGTDSAIHRRAFRVGDNLMRFDWRD